LQFKRGSWRHRNAIFPVKYFLWRANFHAVFPLLTVGIERVIAR
jgi:hypothetical protein